MKHLCLISALLILVQVNLFGQVNLDFGLIAYYPFNGNANDESGNGNNGIVNGATLTTDRFDCSNKAYYFDGLDDYIQTSLSSNTQPLTISVWFKTNVNTGEHSIVDSDWCGQYGQSIILGYWYGDNTLDVQYHDEFYNSPFIIQIGIWYHAVAIFTYGKVELYVNGNFVGSETFPQGALDGDNFRIGRHNIARLQWFNGIIDDIRIYSRILSEQEIQALYNEVVTPVELSFFTAETGNGLITLKWTTQSETENYGFHVYRSQIKDGEYEKITNELIPGTGNSDQAHTYSYIDLNVSSGNTFYYKLADVDFSGNLKFHGPISATVEAVPINYSLEQNYPNPFNPETAINFSLKEVGKVTLKIYNLQGQVVRTLVDEENPIGSNSVMWNATNEKGMKVSSGIYLYIIQVNGFEQTRRLVFMK